MKKYLSLALAAFSFILTACIFLTMMGSAVDVTSTILNKTSSIASCYDLISNGGALYIVALILLILSLVAIALVIGVEVLRKDLSCKKYIYYLAAGLLVVTAVFFFLAVPCFNSLTEIEGVQLGSYANPSLSAGAVLSAVFALISAVVMGITPFVEAKFN